MFDNVGNKIKTLAKVLCWIGIIASIIYAVIIWHNVSTIKGLITLILGPLCSWISCLCLYGFGHLIANSDKLVSVAITKTASKQTLTSSPDYANIKKPAHTWRCNKCGEMILQEPCPYCSTAEDEYTGEVEKNKEPAEGNIICPNCGLEQPANRKCCFKCATKFDI